ncbi:hypothetical protein L6452_34926 [Arctium lappa]|uniref:Uncharacterized protein n=1 Tax=Arctium lappa TaxID=4217 RepID=A0ACB8YJM4_ARCLA|nr:hypothetical protein L6452_34926 [Arctium lappa]
MDSTKQRHLRKLPPNPASGDLDRILGGFHRRVLPPGLGTLALPVRHVAPHRSSVSGCCKPPSICSYQMTTMDEDLDCYKWNNDPNTLCYECDSCKAGVLEDVRRDWRKLSVLNVIITLLLIGIYRIGCCAFRNTRRAETDYPYGENRMSKVRPRWDFFWYASHHYKSISS